MNRDLGLATKAWASKSRRLRQLHRLTQVEAAKKLGIACSTIQQIESAKTLNCPTWLIIKYCTAFEVSPDYLLGYDRMWPEQGQCQRCGGSVSGDPHTIPQCMLSLFDRHRSIAYIAKVFDLTLKTVGMILEDELEMRASRKRCA